MMKDYLKAIILEQINRGVYLKTLITRPVKYSELLSLVERCSRIIDDNIQQLRYLLQELERRDESNIRDIYRWFRTCTRQIELVENYGIPALYHVTPEIGYLNNLIFKIHQEINLPLTPPSVACISTDYYYLHSFTNVIFVPASESGFLLHLPDVFHEIGHEVLYNKEDEVKLGKVNEKYGEAIEKITKHYEKLLVMKTRETGPKDFPRLIEHIHSQWKNYWMEEFFSDLFACYTVGPAYAWSHLHLVTKKTEDVYSFSSFLPQRHPSDDSRMRILFMGLNNLGFKVEATSLLSRWTNMPFVAGREPVVEYQYAYPSELMEEVAKLVLLGLQESNFSIVSQKKLEQLNQNSVVGLLNEAWRMFWNNPQKFREWEKEVIQRLMRVKQ